MKYLLDTHSLIWFLEDNPRLSRKAKLLIENLENEIFVSTASWFEISIKVTIGKLELPDSLAETMARSSRDEITTVSIKESHIIAYQKLLLLDQHRDPFDRLIIATAISEDHTIITSDPKFGLYQDQINIAW
ncbi:MAG: type II toxin-antitoxin system VapC family toxin [Dyadobacter sp.]|uniref:type II toxin-antitoxin system VapC family toxin n=1 Tax=Dyadobacter sp. TaxID=1914288 RepID=UPI0032670AF5